MSIEAARERLQKSSQDFPQLSPETEVQELMDAFVDALRTGDVDEIMSFYSPDIISFDIVPPLKTKGKEAYRKSWEEFIAMYMTPIGYEVRELSVLANENLAFSHSLNHMTGTMKGGTKVDCWFRYTAGFRKQDGKWLIVHEQLSVPIDMESGLGIFDLKPYSD